MAQTFDCPKCGAPLDLKPAPGQESVECPYCHDTVIIPTDLRIPLPKPPRQVIIQSSEPKSRMPTWAWIVIGVVALPFLIGIIVSFFPDKSSSTDSTPAAISAAEAWKKATQQASDNATATAIAKESLATLTPLLSQAQIWPITLSDKFPNNLNKWTTGDVNDSYYTGGRQINDGKYTWIAHTKKSMSLSSFPNGTAKTDFFAGVDVNLVEMPDDVDSDAGLFLRYDDTAQTWYYYSVSIHGEYYFGWYNGTDWKNIISSTYSSAIHRQGVNRIEVVAQGSQFIFLINGTIVDHTIDDHLAKGETGVAINLAGPDESATIEFSNFILRSGDPQ